MATKADDLYLSSSCKYLYWIVLAVLASTVIHVSQSTSPVCPVGTEYRNCSWNLSCSDITGVRRCKEQSPCSSGCFCVNQTVLINGTCSADINSCSVCPVGTEYRGCSWNLSCSDITGVRRCKEQSPCTSGCFCSDGMVLQDGVCSNISSCSVCPVGTEYRDCSRNLSCSDITGVRRCKEESPCASGCFCSDGMVLQDGVCSSISSCSVCPIGTEYRDCSWNLSCSDITGVRRCKEQSPCTSGCFCSDGTVLQDRVQVCSNISSCSVQCPAAVNGTLQCLNETTTARFGATCTFSCNAGYELLGSNNGTCLANQSWSGGDPICVALNCSTSPPLNNSQLQSSCDTQYQSTCTTVCVDGYTGVGGSYTCVVTDEDINSVGWNGSTSCQRVQCMELTNPTNGMISCSLINSPSFSYEDTCSFTCNTGYELTGSDTRTCQSNGSWSGSDDVCGRVSCPLPTAPINGTINCSLGDDELPSYEDTCSFTCNTGYELTGSDTRTCQSDGSWSGSDTVCSRVHCPSLTNPNNGMINCSMGDDGVLSYEDTCSFTCNTGYELTGSIERTCQSDGSWNGTDNMCRRALCLSLTAPENGMINCSLGDDGVPSYEETCSFTCNTGYELTGSDTRTCQGDGSWSDTDVMCIRALNIGNNKSTFQDSQTNDGESGSSGAVIGGAVGGILFIIIVIIVVLVIFYIRQLHRRRTQESKNSKNVAAQDYQNNIAIDNEAYEQSIGVTSSPKPVYEEPSSTYHSILNAALSTITEAQEPRYESSVNWYGVSSPPPQQLIEREEEIYNTPYEDEGNYGPVYCEPPSDEQKIYAEFEGKRFRKLYHREIQSFKELGTGEFGVVTHCKWKLSTNKEVEVAVKALNSNASDKDRLRFLQEAAIMCQFDHQNVIKLHGVVTEAPIMIVLEYMRQGDLKNVLMRLRPVKGITAHAKLPFILLKFCSEIAAGMTYLSGKQFVHRDLAARNVLVSDKIVCKIADFGMSRDLIDSNYYITSGGKIPVKWTAPEALHYRKYSMQSDVWSYACVLYEIWSLGYKPFEELTNIETLRKVDDDFRLPPPPGCPRTIYRVMIKCWHPDPRSRPQFGQITKLLTGNSGYLLCWSDEDKQIGGEDAMKLGAPLESANNLYYDLQMQYKQINRL